MDIIEATQSYEAWLGHRVALYAPDLDFKHDAMDNSLFGFLRATYYRWLQHYPRLCPGRGPSVLSVGDLHLENFGTWRDAEARLVWGIDDFDEAQPCRYDADLVRLAASALIAIDKGKLKASAEVACEQIVAGYLDGLRSPAPFVLEENHSQLRDIAMGKERSPGKFWRKIETYPAATPPPGARSLLLQHLPKGTASVSFARKTEAGTGGLGVPRFLAIGIKNGGRVCREVKRRAPVAQAWVGGAAAKPAPYAAILKQAVRSADPYLAAAPHWIVSRLAPHCERINMKDIDDKADVVLRAMGREAANIHCRAGATRLILKDLARRSDAWLHLDASRMAEATAKDWMVWKRRPRA
jgi:hypothetical protein